MLERGWVTKWRNHDVAGSLFEDVVLYAEISGVSRMSATSSLPLNKQAENIVQKKLLNTITKEELEVLKAYAKQHTVNQPKNSGPPVDTSELGSEEELKKKKEVTVNNLRRNASRKNRKSRRTRRNDSRKTRPNRR